MPIESTVHLFLHDPMFVNQEQSFRVAIDAGGVCRLSGAALSYFNDLYTVRDSRAARTPGPSVATPTRALLLADRYHEAAFLDLLALVPGAQRDQLFAILDRLVFNHNPATSVASLDAALSADAAYAVYTPGSLTQATTRHTGIAYLAGGTHSFQCPDWVGFRVTLTQGGVTSAVDLKVWVDSQAFYDGYPLSTVMAVVPPLGYDQVLNAPLTGAAGSSALVTAAASATLNQSLLAADIRTQDASGYLTQLVRLYDAQNNTLLVPFNILYKGAVPDRLTCRLAIRAKALVSGYGTETQWRQRIPELYIDSQIYLIPQWTTTTNLPDQVVHPSVMPIKAALEAAKLVLPAVDDEFLADHMEALSAAYNTMMVLVVPNPANAPEKRSFLALHPTYRDFASHEPGYAYMAEATRRFALALNTLLPMAAGLGPVEGYALQTDNGLTYIPFDVGFTEFCVVTKESFRNRTGL